MTYDPRYTTTTPIEPDGTVVAFMSVSGRRTTPASQPSDPATHTDPPTPPTTGDSAAHSDICPNCEMVDTRNAELAENCRVLTELAQQLTNELHSLYDPSTLSGRRAAKVQTALNAAAELGITPTD